MFGRQRLPWAAALAQAPAQQPPAPPPAPVPNLTVKQKIIGGIIVNVPVLRMVAAHELSYGLESWGAKNITPQFKSRLVGGAKP